MKHWSEFIDTRTHATRQLGKMAIAVSFETKSKELELQSLKSSLENLEIKIECAIALQYANEADYKKAIETAKTKALNWNNSPIMSHKPHPKNKK